MDDAGDSCSAQTTPRTPDSPRKLDILLHNCDALGVQGAEICIFEEVNEEGLCCFLESLDGLGLPAEDACAGGCHVHADLSDLDSSVSWGLFCIVARIETGRGGKSVPVLQRGVLV